MTKKRWLELRFVDDSDDAPEVVHETEIDLSELDLTYQSQIGILQDDVLDFVRLCIIEETKGDTT